VTLSITQARKRRTVRRFINDGLESCETTSRYLTVCPGIYRTEPKKTNKNITYPGPDLNPRHLEYKELHLLGITPYSPLKVDRCFGGTCLHLQDLRISQVRNRREARSKQSSTCCLSQKMKLFTNTARRT
jgi:hypothetical protein